MMALLSLTKSLSKPRMTLWLSGKFLLASRSTGSRVRKLAFASQGPAMPALTNTVEPGRVRLLCFLTCVRLTS
jgi:hypothetical protein